MDHGAFDNLTRSMAGGADSRRAALRLLAGGALSGLLARLGLDDAESKKKRGKRHDDQRRSDQLRSAGKKHKKHKHKHKDKDKKKDKDKPDIPPLPPECQDCGTCQMCNVNSCVPDPDLDGVRCLDNPQDPAGDCHVCNHGLCVFKCHYQDMICCKGVCHLPCIGGKVFDQETCQCKCPDGQWECPGPEGIEICWPMEECCPGKKRCGAATCIDVGKCCDQDPDPECDDCQEEFCDNGARACRDKSTKPTCSSTERYDCDTGQCVCREGWETCGELFRCNCYVGDGVRQCMGGTCCPPSLYCAATVECCQGDSVCTPEGCCPSNWIVNGHCVWYS